MPELTDISVIRALCEKYDFALSKGFGQNFIINPGIPTKIVDASGVDKRYGVIEIGPGIGVLTKESWPSVPPRWCPLRWTSACRRCWPRPWPGWTTSSWCCRTC